ncbi:MAG: tRNA 2-thiouridine(34) synthase MnmA [Pseudomonadota bacterium]|nr:tRNA 2-thiouridine(34) synthase MnmA [Pseudomonadota bacterium]
MNSLGIEKFPHDTRVIVAMSGGVDSSVTAGLLLEQGYQVVGITLQLFDYGSASSMPGACCAGQDIHDAKNVAGKLGFPHYVFDFEKQFHGEVIEKFADSYLDGETPVPCIKCNQTVKFRDLLLRAKAMGGDVLATGHYVDRIAGHKVAELHRGADSSKDQSYFLFATTQEQINFLRFPLGQFSKDETRTHATRFGLKIADKPDSQDICFVPKGKYGDLIRKLRPQDVRKGEIVDIGGQLLGEHNGIIDYTVGQRRGLNIGGGTPLYVVRIDAVANKVIVGPKEALARSSIFLREVNWLGETPLGVEPVKVSVKLRSAQPLVSAEIIGHQEGRATVTLGAAELGVSPGHACVFYQGSLLLGGGWIEKFND